MFIPQGKKRTRISQIDTKKAFVKFVKFVKFVFVNP